MSLRTVLSQRFGGLGRQVCLFLVQPASPRPLAVLRIGLGSLLLAQALALAPYLGDLFGSGGVMNASISDSLNPPYVPRLAWAAAALAPLGVGEPTAILLVFGAHLAGALAMLVGWHTRVAVFVAWLTNLAFMTRASTTLYGANEFVNIALFYCLFFPVGGVPSLDCANKRPAQASWGNRLALRVLQFHLLIVYVTSGIEKGSGEQWWNGEAIWRALTRTDLGALNVGWLASLPWLVVAVTWGTVVLEAGYGVAVWLPRVGRWWVVGIILMHAGIAVALNLWFFSAVMILLNSCAWLVPAAPAAGTRHLKG